MKMLAIASETFYFKVCNKQDRKSLDAEEGKIHKNYLTDLLDWLTWLIDLLDCS